MTEIDGAEVEAVDVITFGSPCQDLSVAGKRAGLKHSANGDDETTRSGLFMEAVRIIKEMRRATNGEYPKYAIWENVMGAFSSNSGEDFRVVLEELVKICEPEAPPIPSPGKTGWPYADCIMGDGWSLAWRVFDAQYWPGTPQRRRRIYLVLDLTSGCAEKVLFEREGLRGYSPESGTPWKGAAGNPQKGAGADDPEGGCVGFDCYNQLETGSVSKTVDTIKPPCVAVPYTLRSASDSDIAATLYAAYGTKWNGNAGAYNGENFVLEEYKAYGITCKGNGDGFASEERHTALSAGGGQPGQGYPCVMQPIAVATQQGGAEISENGICPTITAAAGMSGNNQPWICGKTFIIDNIGGQAEYGKESHVNGTLRAGAQGAVAVYEWHNQDSRIQGPIDVACTLNTNAGGREGHLVMENTAYATDVGFFNTCEDVSPTMLARMYKDPHLVCYEKEPQYIVRRLTPTECARLQGFPDRWGDIPHKDTLTDEEYSFWLDVRNTHAAINGRATKEYTKEQLLTWYNKLHSDSSEYKMWGNGIALPNALYVMQGIADAIIQKERRSWKNPQSIKLLCGSSRDTVIS